MLDIYIYIYNIKSSVKIYLIGRITINRLAIPCLSAKNISFFTRLIPTYPGSHPRPQLQVNTTFTN
jgi:hypothetical protein